MSNYTNKDIALTLSDLRSKIRNGAVTLYFRGIPGRPVEDAGTVLRKAVAAAFGIDKDAFNTENFNAQTLKRFATLFDVPLSAASNAFRYPSQDDTAWALQNFINRRADPWGTFKRQSAEAATVTDAISSLVAETQG